MANQFTSQNIKDTQNFAKKIAIENKWRVFGLVGDLGSGKTTFAQAFLRSLGVKQKITSPTFVIIKKYQLKKSVNRNPKPETYFHIDCYRLHRQKEFLDLNFQEVLNDSKNIILIEWADRIRDLLPKETKWIYFEHGKNENERIIKY